MVSIQLGTAFIAIRASLKQLDGDLARVRQVMTRSLTRISKRMQGIGRRMTTSLALPALALGAGILRSAFQFQKAMNRVAALTGATGKDFEKLSAQARKLGETTEFSAVQAGEGMAFLAQTGFEVNEILSAMPGVLQLASAGQLDLGTAADIASNVLTQFRMEAEEIVRVNDVLAKVQATANVTIVQAAESLKFVGTTAQQAQIPIEDITAAIGLLGDAGLQGGISGTSLNRAIINMLKPTDEGTKTMRKLGLTVIDTSDRIRPLADIVRDIEKAILEGGITATEVGLILEVFGIRGGRAIGALVGRGEDLAKLTERLKDAGGTAERIQKIQLRGLVGAVVELKSAIEGAALSVTRAGLQGFTERMLRSMTGLARKLSATNPEILRFGTVVVSALGIAGPALLGLAIILRGVAIVLVIFLRRLFVIPALMLAIGLSVRQAAVQLQAFYDFIKGVKPAEDFMQRKGFFAGITDDLKKIADTIVDFLDPAFESLFGKLPKDQIEELKKALDLAKGSVKDLGTEVTKTSSAFEQAFPGMGKFNDEIQKGLVGALADANFELELVQKRFGDLAPEAVHAAREAGVLADALKRIGEGKDGILVVDRALVELSDRIKEVTRLQDEQADSTQRLERLGADLGFTFASALEDAIVSGKSLGDILEGLAQDIIRILTRLAITVPLTRALEDLFSGGFSFFQHGGNIRRGQPGIVGEAGPELFIPRVGGTIVPSSRLEGASFPSGPTVQIQVFAPPGSEVSEQTDRIGDLDRVRLFIDQATADNMRPGTRTFRAIRDTFGSTQTVVSR